MRRKRKRSRNQQVLRRKEKRRRSVRSGLLEKLDEVDQWIQREDWTQARESLKRLDREWPRRAEILSRLAHVCYVTQDDSLLRDSCHQLVELNGHDPELTLMLASAHLRCSHAASALTTFRRFLDHWPRDPRAGSVRETVAELEEVISNALIAFGFTGDDGLELAVMHEQVQHHLSRGDYRQVRATAERLLDRQPRFVPALNNMSIAAFFEGKAEEAIAVSLHALEIQSDNCHALANLVRYLYLSGRPEEARRWADQLKSLQGDLPDQLVKTAEALAVLGDDRGILDAFDTLKRGRHATEPSATALLLHYAGFASLRLGDEQRARRMWQEALRRVPSLDDARGNLKDLDNPVKQRNGPWALTFNHYLSQSTVDQFVASLDQGDQHDDGWGRRKARDFLNEHPEIAALIPILFDRGDPGGCEFAYLLVSLARTPALLEDLRRFLFGQHGTDQLRSRAAQLLAEEKLLPAGPVRMWIMGEWREVVFHLWEINDKPAEDEAHSPEVKKLKDQAIDAWRRGDVEAAESLLHRALELEPDAPDLLNNLAGTWQLQGRGEEATELMRRIHEARPDYLFARAFLARILARKGEYDQAIELLKPLTQRKRLTHAEIESLCAAHVEVFWHKGDREVAASWHRLWKTVNPASPSYKYWERCLSGTPLD